VTAEKTAKKLRGYFFAAPCRQMKTLIYASTK